LSQQSFDAALLLTYTWKASVLLMHTARLVWLCGFVAVALAVAPRQSAAQADKATVGKTLFQRRGCAGCHGIGKKGKMAGPDLGGVSQRRSNAWLKSWLKSPDTMIFSDSTAKALYEQYNKTKMPNMKLSDEEIEALIAYIDQQSAKS
jgi:mono/diheme cytochrome c family protein